VDRRVFLLVPEVATTTFRAVRRFGSPDHWLAAEADDALI
jgi:hypothetical protein